MIYRPKQVKEATVCVDPGVNYMAVAVFDCGDLVAATKIRSTLPKLAPDQALQAVELAQNVKDWAIEVMKEHSLKPQEASFLVEGQQTRGSAPKGDPQPLVQLGVRAGALLYAFSPMCRKVVMVPPTIWKGTIPKNMMLARIRGLLTDGEKGRMKQNKDTLDAVGIGLWWTKRM